ncbi:hypothetical protein QBC46DRAFT_436203 [Diplogelasinospora grovesii]|uniref:Cyclin N-terminal domain-containing protein n=1 Tax=Diplogelasinospora grovesii TaxID=303347 RepID=A0AAN6RXG1_9PEZI|nr:hypothetical protein QBC46DRAFT_436203 [Diplogelasinospora grovesii]
MAHNLGRPKHGLNAAALWRLVCQPICPEMVTYISDFTAGIVWCNPNLNFPHTEISSEQSSTKTRPPYNGTISHNYNSLPTLHEFIARLIRDAKVPTATFISTVVYLTRLKACIFPFVFHEGRCTAHRIFLSVLILTSKYLNDQSPSNKNWAQYWNAGAGNESFWLSLRDIARLEMQTLDLLGWNLRITEEDLYVLLEPCLKPIRHYLDWNISEMVSGREGGVKAKGTSPST